MEYSEDHAVIREWMPLVIRHRHPNDILAATHMAIGTDVNFGALTNIMLHHITKHDTIHLAFGQEVVMLKKDTTTRQRLLKIRDVHTGKSTDIKTSFVFIGAG